MLNKAQKFIWQVSSVRKLTISAIMLLILFFLCGAAPKTTLNTFIVSEDGRITAFNSTKELCTEALAEAGISIDNNKYAEMPEKAQNGVAEIEIYKKKKINLNVGGTPTILYCKDGLTVSELLAENNITLSEFDKISLPSETPVSDEMEIRITRISHNTETVTEEIPFSVEKRPSAAMKKGKTKTVQEGVKGSKALTYDVEITNGTESSRTLLKESVTKEPVKKIIEYGTKIEDTSGIVKTKSGAPLKYKKVITMTATAYTTERTSDKITATGQVARVGLVAVDRRVIPLGTRLYIEAADGKSWSYGIAVAADTGVRGNKIDLFFDTYKECIRFGRKKAKVYILE